MSQSKVDQRKYEKKHRKEILRKQKVKKVLAVTITIVVIAGIVAVSYTHLRAHET